MMQDYISVKEAKERYGLSGQRIRQLLSNGTVKGRKFGITWAVDVKSLEDYLGTVRKPGRKKIQMP
jgi:hypothetical protein